MYLRAKKSSKNFASGLEDSRIHLTIRSNSQTFRAIINFFSEEKKCHYDQARSQDLEKGWAIFKK